MSLCHRGLLLAALTFTVAAAAGAASELDALHRQAAELRQQTSEMRSAVAALTSGGLLWRGRVVAARRPGRLHLHLERARGGDYREQLAELQAKLARAEQRTDEARINGRGQARARSASPVGRGTPRTAQATVFGHCSRR